MANVSSETPLQKLIFSLQAVVSGSFLFNDGRLCPLPPLTLAFEPVHAAVVSVSSYIYQCSSCLEDTLSLVSSIPSDSYNLSVSSSAEFSES